MAGDPRLEPERANSTLNSLIAHGERMAGAWNTTKADIAALAGQLGQGELGAAFLDGYRQLAAEVADAVDECCRRPGEFTAAATPVVTAFDSVDHVHQQAIRSNTV